MKLPPSGALGALCLAAAVAFGASHAQSTAEAAARDGEVVWYTAMNTSDTEPLRKGFEQKYPGVKVTIYRQPGEKVRTRILAEAEAHRYSWDVVSFNALDMEVLDGARMLAPYVSPQTAKGFAPGAVQREGRWAAIYVRQYVIGYNTQSVRPDDAPKDWSDLLEPRWKGKLAMDEDDVEWYAGMLDAMGREKGTAYMRALARQGPQLRRGHSLLTKLLVAGDFPLALVHAAEIDSEKKAGAPVDWVRTLDPIVTAPSVVAISSHAPHPGAARLLVDFLLSREGQEIIARRGRVPARLDVVPAEAAALKVHYIKPSLAREFNRDEREYTDIFVRGRSQ